MDIDLLMQTTLMFAASWLLLGLGAGISLGIVALSGHALVRATVGAALGGLLAGLMYPLAAAFVFPVDATDRAVPGGVENRLFWSILAFVLIGAVAVWQGRQPQAEKG
jgi:hypothetical protein